MKKLIPFLIAIILLAVMMPQATVAQYGTAGGVSLTLAAGSNALTDSTRYYNKIIAAVYTPMIKKLTADTATTQIFPGLPIGGLTFNVTSGTYYRFDFFILWTASNASGGLKIKMTTPTTTTFGASVAIGGSVVQAKGTDWNGYISTIATDSVDATTTAVATTQYPCHVFGAILPSANGVVTVLFNAANASYTTTIKQGSYVLVESGY
jgi:hypothetical protein